MRIPAIIKVFVVVALFSVLAVPAAAQTKPAAAPATSGSGGSDMDLGVAYSFEHFGCCGSAPAGVVVDFGKKLTKVSDFNLDLTAEFGIHKFPKNSAEEFLAGARFITKYDKHQFFGEFKAGLIHGTNTDFEIMFGAGVDFVIPGKGFNFRLSGDFPVFFKGGGHAGFRFDAGVVFPLGKK